MAQIRRGLLKGSAQSVPQRRVLAVVVVVVDMVVHVMGGSIHQRLQEGGYSKVAVVNRHGPNVHKDVQVDVGHLGVWGGGVRAGVGDRWRGEI